MFSLQEGYCVKLQVRGIVYCMKRSAVIKRLSNEAKSQGLDFRVVELTNRTGIIIDGLRKTIGRHGEVDELTVVKFFKQIEDVLGKWWWRK